MKKKIFLSFSLMLLVSAGVWPQENAFGGKYVNAFKADSVVWKCYWDFSEEKIKLEDPFDETVLHGDTVVSGKQWRIIRQGKALKGLIRSENNRVMFKPYPGYENTVHQDYRKQKETVIYDFSLKVGESIPSIGIVPSGKVTKIDSVMFEDGHKHKRIHVGEYYSYIEGLGNDRYSPFFMLAHALPTMPSRPTFMCCHVDNRLLYRNPAFKNCDGQKVANVIITGGLSEAKVSFADGQLTVSLKDGRMFNVAVFNAQGMLVAQQQQNRYETRIPFGNEAKGVYFVRIQAGQAVATHKIVHARNK
ncbi:MAG: T9SS type A sorting domain-containing protein [Tannerella forsythia]|uniref:T9SS type A sorting domain-containing protein n=1 Tax=Tannerella forsythia TaxID=28112 RepID=UPI00360F62D3